MLAAQGDAEAILARAHASSAAVEMLAMATSKKGSERAVALRVAEQYVSAFGNIAKKGTTLILPADAGNVGSMVAQALGVFQTLSSKSSSSSSEEGSRLELSDGSSSSSGEGSSSSSSSSSINVAEETEKLYQDALKTIRGSSARGFDYESTTRVQQQQQQQSPQAASDSSSYSISSAEAAKRMGTEGSSSSSSAPVDLSAPFRPQPFSS